MVPEHTLATSVKNLLVNKIVTFKDVSISNSSMMWGTMMFGEIVSIIVVAFVPEDI